MIDSSFKVFTATLFLAVTCHDLTTAADESREQIEAVFKGDADSVSSAITSEIKRRAIVDDALIEILASSSKDSARATAANALRQFRTVNAVSVLVRNLTVLQSDVVSGPGLTPHVGINPCALALISIGEPSVNPLLFLLRTSIDAKEREIAVYSLREILGPDNCIKAIQKELVHNQSKDEKYNLQSGIDTIHRAP